MVHQWKVSRLVPARELLDQMRRQKLDLVKAIDEGSLDHIAGSHCFRAGR
jgi:hypothetical protein